MDLTAHSFGPVVRYPVDAKFTVMDLSTPEAAERMSVTVEDGVFSIGKYNEKRGIYTTAMYTDGVAEEDRRCVHLGIDLGGPVGFPVFAPCAGVVDQVGYNADAGDYGHVIITRHDQFGEQPLYLLFGHLASDCLKNTKGTVFEQGALLGHLGDRHENGDWPPHLHFQLSVRAPVTHDLPGVCSERDREQCLKDFPDPRLILGPIYTE